MPSALDEKDAIREVLAQYCFALDDGKFAEMAACFTEDGTWHTAFGKATGRKAIAEFAAGLRAHRPGPTPRATEHGTDVVVTLSGTSGAPELTTVQNRRRTENRPGRRRRRRHGQAERQAVLSAIARSTAALPGA
jgi:uncharacterized protein (TIGR02246 family)